MKKFILILVLVSCCLVLTSDTAMAWYWRPLKHKHYHVYHKPTYVVYISTYDFNRDRVIDLRDRLLWIQKHYVPNTVVSVTIVSEEKNFLCELDLNKNGIIESSEMAYWVSRYDINKNGVLEEYEINMALA